MKENPARWIPNPDGSNSLRFWDGKAWTSHVHDLTEPETKPSKLRFLLWPFKIAYAPIKMLLWVFKPLISIPLAILGAIIEEISGGIA